uniref:Uncharacterized protein n=1 Tax=uncultured marine virus TaxID=186617 RepID=A0A0F7L4W8_9VIRU|nr:hypothetical protein [uncultured marine virus]
MKVTEIQVHPKGSCWSHTKRVIPRPQTRLFILCDSLTAIDLKDVPRRKNRPLSIT